MKKLLSVFISITAFTLAHNLQAQTKLAVRKSTVSTSRTTAVQTAPVKKTVSPANYTNRQPAPETAIVQSTQSTAPAPLRTSGMQRTPVSRPLAPVRVRGSNIRVGFRAGVNSSLISGLDFSAVPRDLQPARVTGFHAGAVFTIGGPTFSVQPELLFSQYGIRMTSGSDYVQLKYNLLEVPILLKASFGQPNLRVFINAGPVVTYTMNGTVSLLDAGRSDSGKIDLAGTSRLSYGASGGSGIALKAGPGTVQLEARYTYLFSSNENGAKINPQNFMVSAGYLIPLGGR